MILSFINICKVPREVLKTEGEAALGFQHFPRDLANVNEWKIMFDPSIITGIYHKRTTIFTYRWNRVTVSTTFYIWSIFEISCFNANCVDLDQTAPFSRSTNGHHTNSPTYIYLMGLHFK